MINIRSTGTSDSQHIYPLSVLRTSQSQGDLKYRHFGFTTLHYTTLLYNAFFLYSVEFARRSVHSKYGYIGFTALIFISYASSSFLGDELIFCTDASDSQCFHLISELQRTSWATNLFQVNRIQTANYRINRWQPNK